MQTILILKTGALGDVLRTTSILPGLAEVHPGARIEWVTAPAAADLVRGHARVARTHLVDPQAPAEVEALGEELAATDWEWVISLDDERPLCALATRLGGARLSGAHLDGAGERAYTPDVGAWFDMGLLSVHGKQEADRRKLANRRSQPEIYAEMLGIPMGRPELELDVATLARGRERLAACGEARPRIGLNTGAGGRWTSKQLPEERVVELATGLREALGGAEGHEPAFVLLGGREEAERNARLRGRFEALAPPLVLVDAGVDNTLLEFAGIVDGLDLLVTSDSLALHVGVARRVPIVAFFAPTSAAEIELYGLGEKVRSLAPDYASYRPEADNSTITAERLVEASVRVLGAPGGRPGGSPGH